MIHFLKPALFLLICLLHKFFPRAGLPVLFFHSVDESGSVISISSDRFQRFIKYFHSQGYTTLSLNEFKNYLMNKSFKKDARKVLITFDDGYKNNIAAADKLGEYNFSAVIFVSTAHIGGVNNFCRKDVPVLPMMNADEIQSLARRGIEFGAHGHTHANLPDLDAEALMYEIKESKRILEEYTAKPVDSFCYPRGKVNKTVVRALEELGFKIAFTSKTGIVSRASDPRLLPRVPLNNAVSDLQFKALLSPWYGFFRNIFKRL